LLPGSLILVWPCLLNYILASYFIVTGIIGLAAYL